MSTYRDQLACLDAGTLGSLAGKKDPAAVAARQAQRQAQRAANQAAKAQQQAAGKARKQQRQAERLAVINAATPRTLYRPDGTVAITDPRYAATFRMSRGLYKGLAPGEAGWRAVRDRKIIRRDAKRQGQEFGINPALYDAGVLEAKPRPIISTTTGAEVIDTAPPPAAAAPTSGGGGIGGLIGAILELLFGPSATGGSTAAPFASTMASGYSDGAYIDAAATSPAASARGALATFADPYGGFTPSANPQLGSWLSDAFRGKGGPLGPLVGAVGMIPGIGQIASAVGTAAFAKAPKEKKPKALAPAPAPAPVTAPAGITITPTTALALGAIALLALKK